MRFRKENARRQTKAPLLYRVRSVFEKKGVPHSVVRKAEEVNKSDQWLLAGDGERVGLESDGREVVKKKMPSGGREDASKNGLERGRNGW